MRFTVCIQKDGDFFVSLGALCKCSHNIGEPGSMETVPCTRIINTVFLAEAGTNPWKMRDFKPSNVPVRAFQSLRLLE